MKRIMQSLLLVLVFGYSDIFAGFFSSFMSSASQMGGSGMGSSGMMVAGAPQQGVGVGGFMQKAMAMTQGATSLGAALLQQTIATAIEKRDQIYQPLIERDQQFVSLQKDLERQLDGVTSFINENKSELRAMLANEKDAIEKNGEALVAAIKKGELLKKVSACAETLLMIRKLCFVSMNSGVAIEDVQEMPMSIQLSEYDKRTFLELKKDEKKVMSHLSDTQKTFSKALEQFLEGATLLCGMSDEMKQDSQMIPQTKNDVAQMITRLGKVSVSKMPATQWEAVLQPLKIAEEAYFRTLKKFFLSAGVAYFDESLTQKRTDLFSFVEKVVGATNPTVEDAEKNKAQFLEKSKALSDRYVAYLEYCDAIGGGGPSPLSLDTTSVESSQFKNEHATKKAALLESEQKFLACVNALVNGDRLALSVMLKGDAAQDMIVAEYVRRRDDARKKRGEYVALCTAIFDAIFAVAKENAEKEKAAKEKAEKEAAAAVAVVSGEGALSASNAEAKPSQGDVTTALSGQDASSDGVLLKIDGAVSAKNQSNSVVGADAFSSEASTSSQEKSLETEAPSSLNDDEGVTEADDALVALDNMPIEEDDLDVLLGSSE